MRRKKALTGTVREPSVSMILAQPLQELIR
jgi:hypothetical protein